MGSLAADVCSFGVAEPPFLSYGVKSNLLLVMDNSGSMLDMAYEDPDETLCFDDSYNSSTVYVGNFETKDSGGNNFWYQWVEGPYAQWQNATEYGDTGEPTRVYVNGIIYEVDGACTSAGDYIAEDGGCTWNKLVDVDIWRNNVEFLAGEYVVDRKQQYLTQSTCTSSAGEGIEDDTNCNWEPVEHSYRDDIAYAAGDIVTYNGKFYEALNVVGAGVTPQDSILWSHLSEGYFQEVPVLNIITECVGAAGDYDYSDSLCISVDETVTPFKATAFIANGNLLNWAMASKFDIQKEILTGGKYDEDLGFIVSESRGCAGRGYVKEIDLRSGDVLTMRVRGSVTEDGEPNIWDWVDTTDDTARLEIIGFSATGFDMESCEAAIDKILTVGSGFQNDVDNCLGGAGVNSERNSLNHALQYCWQDTHVRNLKTISDDCEGLYEDAADPLSPSKITPFNNAYNCNGIYDDNYDHDDRTGYVGRCYELATGGGGTTCDPYVQSNADCNSNVNTCYFSDGGNYFRNKKNNNYTDICTSVDLSKTGNCNNNGWETYYLDSAGAVGNAACDPNDGAYTGGGDGDWSDVLYPSAGDPTDYTLDPDYAAGIIPNNPGIGDGTDAEWWCVYQAMEDYCGDLTVPEVIDPSDQASTSTDYWNIPGNLIDSGVFSQLGVEQPLIVMKGYLAIATQPEGILQEVKEDLRIGVMAFNDNGAKTECDVAGNTGNIEKYCPSYTQDGAEVMANIQLGSTDVGGGLEHIDNVVTAINDTRATSWTPLAEAVFSAFGYYSQQTSIRLNDDDFQVSAGTWITGTSYEGGDIVTWPDVDGNDVYYEANAAGISSGTNPTDDTGVTWFETTNPDPVTNWCQDNHILIITEGASTADINQDVIDYVGGSTGVTVNDGDQGDDQACLSDLNSSTYLDDLTYIGQNADAQELYGANYYLSTGEDSDGDGNIDVKDKRNITTHIVVAGSLRVDDTSECSPDVLISEAATNGGTALVLGENPADLEAGLLEKFNELRQRASAGSAASVISSSRGGEGAIYQAIFWPELTRKDDQGNDRSVEWVGDVHALFVSDAGYLYEDTNGDRTLNPSEDVDGDGVLDVTEDLNLNGIIDLGEDVDGDGKLDVAEDLNMNNSIDGSDLRVIIYFDDNAGVSKACYNDTIETTGACTFEKSLDEVKFLWSAAEWLNDPALITADNRPYLSNEKKRYIFTWIDLNNDGIVDDDHDGTVDADDEIRPFIAGLANGLVVSGTRSPVYADFGVATTGEVDDIVGWIRGNDGAGQRSRQMPDSEGSAVDITYRLGDVIHSTPMAVSDPAEGFHLLYRDRSYADFVVRHKERRHMLYFGGNDGMLHAVNGGFYKEQEKKFCLADDIDVNGDCVETAGNLPVLGAEMWSYVPYNMLPHLNCLTDEAYAHKYFVDLRPRIFDVKIFQEEAACAVDVTSDACIHPNGWGTILVGGMRFGGSPVDAYEVSVDPADGLTDDNRQFISSYFVLDVTDPETPAKLLGELTQTLDNSGNQNFVDLGYSTVISSMAIMKNPATYGIGIEENSWYLVLGSGPHGDDALKGVSDQNAKLSILPLEWLGGTDITNSSIKTALRIPAAAPVALGNGGGTFTLPSANGFVSDAITLDFDINPSTFDYMTDAIYFGTTEGDFITNADETTEWDGGGKLYRLITRNLDINGESGYGPLFTQTPTTPDQWQISTMLDLTIQGKDKPISSSPNAGYDGKNFWIYVGTGRFWHADDKTDANQQTYFGLREPIQFDTDGNPTLFYWDEIEFIDNIDANTGTDIGLGTNAAGNRGLLRVDDILVDESASAIYAGLSCRDTTDIINGASLVNDLSCVPEVIRQGTSPDTAYFDRLESYIAGDFSSRDCANDDVDCADGWYKDFWPYSNRERNLGQSTLLGGLLTFTTYQPYNDPCQAEGQAFLYGVYYRTGTSWFENVFGLLGLDSEGNVKNKLSLGAGMATTPNLQTGAESKGPRAFIQTSTGEIKEIQQQNLPIKGFKSGRSKWKEYIP